MPQFDEQTGVFMDRGVRAAGRVPHRPPDVRIFAAAWPNSTDPNDPVAAKLNTAAQVRRVADAQGPVRGRTRPSSTVTRPGSSATSRQPGNELQVHGSGKLCGTCWSTTWSTGSTCWSSRSSCGAGERLFPDAGLDTRLEAGGVAESTPSGVQISTYRPPAGATYGERRRCSHALEQETHDDHDDTTEPTTQTLEVPGATLTYDVRRNDASTRAAAVPDRLADGAPPAS